MKLKPSISTIIGNWLSMDTNLRNENIILQLMNRDLIDAIWQSGRPARPSSTINALPIQFSGIAISFNEF